MHIVAVSAGLGLAEICVHCSALLLEMLDSSTYIRKASLARHPASLTHDSLFPKELQAKVHVGWERKLRELRAEER